MRTDTASYQAVVVTARQLTNERQKLKQLFTSIKRHMKKPLAGPQHIPLAHHLHKRIISLASKQMIRAHPIRRTITHNRVRPRTRTPAFPFRKFRPTPRRRPALVSKPAGNLLEITRRLTLNRFHTRKPSRHNKHTSKPNTPNPHRPSMQHPLPQPNHITRARPSQMRSHAASPPIYPPTQPPHRSKAIHNINLPTQRHRRHHLSQKRSFFHQIHHQSRNQPHNTAQPSLTHPPIKAS